MASATSSNGRAKKVKAAPAFQDDSSWIGATVRSMDVVTQGRGARTMHAELVARNYGHVFSCIDRLATGVASTLLRVFRKKQSGSRKTAWQTRAVSRELRARMAVPDGTIRCKAIEQTDNIEEVIDPLHPLVACLNDANDFQNGYDLLEFTQKSIDLAGNGYWYVTLGAGHIPEKLWTMAPQWTTIKPSKTTFIESYRYGRNDREAQDYVPEQVVHFKNVNLVDPYYGMGAVQAIVGEADLSIAFTKFAHAMLDNGCQPSSVFVLKGATEAQRKQFEAQLHRKYQGVENAMRSLVTNGDVDVKSLGLREKEVAFLQSDDAVLKKICAALAVPVAMLTLDGSIQFANGRVASPVFQMFGVRPRCTRIEQQINAKLVPMFNDPTLFVGFDNPAIEDENQKVDRLVKLSSGSRPIISINEARSELGGYESVEGGDEVLIALPKPEITVAQEPANQPQVTPQAGTTDVQATALSGAQVTAMSDMVAQAAAGTVPLDSLKPMMLAAFPLVSIELIDQIVASLVTFEPPVVEPPPPPPEPPPESKPVPKSFAKSIWSERTKDKPGTPPSEAMAEALAAVFRDAKVLAPRMAMEPGLVAQHMLAFGLDQMVMDALTPGLETMLTGGYNLGAADVRGRVDIDPFNLASPDARRFLETYRIRSARTVLDTVEQQVRSALTEGLATGTTLDELTKKVGEVLDGYATHGAERIARSETARAYMHGREEAWKASGVVEQKEWLLSSDPCPLCIAVSDQLGKSALGVPFVQRGGSVTDATGAVHVLDYSDVQGPPAHPNCRCSLGAVFKGET